MTIRQHATSFALLDYPLPISIHSTAQLALVFRFLFLDIAYKVHSAYPYSGVFFQHDPLDT